MAKCGINLVEVTPALKEELQKAGIAKARLRGRVLLEFEHLFLGKYVAGSYMSQYYLITAREETPKVRQAVRAWEQRTGRKIETLYEK
jgi:hypothetical protein